MIKNMNVYLIGIGGISMSGIAQFLKQVGNQVSGSDIKVSAQTKKLADLGIKVFKGHQASNITQDIDLVVKTDAIPDDNPELIKAKQFNIQIKRRMTIIQEIVGDRKLIAIAGTHGKSTVTGMVAKILIACKQDPTILLGANWSEINNVARVGKGDWAVVEACEYKGAFWDLEPDVIVITNIEAEHLDFYKNLSEVEKGFAKFINKLKPQGKLIICSDNKTAVKVAKQTKKDFYGYNIGQALKLKVFGRHNQLNAQAALAVAKVIGLDQAKAEQALANFQGLERRSEFLAEQAGILVYDDYAHHPTEVKATIKAFTDKFKNKRLLVVFQPHQSQRLNSMFDKFKESLQGISQLIIVKVYQPAGRDQEFGKTAEDLVTELNNDGQNALYAQDYDQAVDIIKKQAKKGDVLLTMGAGPVDQVAKSFLKK